MKSQMTIDGKAPAVMGLAEAVELVAESMEGLCPAARASSTLVCYMAMFTSRFELDRAYFMAGGLSDLAQMQGQPF